MYFTSLKLALLKFLLLNCKFSLAEWLVGRWWDCFSLWWWWMGRNYLIRPKEPLSIIFLLHRCPWLTKAISPAIPVYNGLVFLFVLANFSMATFMDPGVFPRGKRKWDWWVVLFFFFFPLVIFLVYVFTYFLHWAVSRVRMVVKCWIPSSELGGVSCPCTCSGWQLRAQGCIAWFSFE